MSPRYPQHDPNVTPFRKSKNGDTFPFRKFILTFQNNGTVR